MSRRTLPTGPITLSPDGRMLFNGKPLQVNAHAGAAPDPEIVRAFREAMSASTQEVRNEAIQHHAELQARLVALEQAVATGATQSTRVSIASPGADFLQLMSDDTDLQRATRAAQNGGQIPSLKARAELSMSIKALLTGDGSSSEAGFPTRTDRAPGIYVPGMRPLRLLDFLPQRPTTSNSVEFIQVTTDDEASEQIAEGEDKPELELYGLLATAHISTIAAWTKASRQVLSDNASLQSVIDRLLRYKVTAKLEHRLINGDGTNGKIDGFLNQAYSFAPAIAETIGEIVGEAMVAQSNLGFLPNLVVLSPIDWFDIRTSKDNEGGYIFGAPNVNVPAALWNASIVTTPSMPAGTGMVIDTAYTTVLDREQVNVSVSNSHDDFFVKNLVAILAEMRAGLEIVDQNAVYKFNLELPSSGA